MTTESIKNYLSGFCEREIVPFLSENDPFNLASRAAGIVADLRSYLDTWHAQRFMPSHLLAYAAEIERVYRTKTDNVTDAMRQVLGGFKSAIECL